MFNVSNLSEYVAPATEMLLKGIVYSEDYARYTVMSGIKHKEYLNYLDANPTLQAGGCDVTASGTTTFDEKEIEVKKFSVVDKFCLSDLDEKDMSAEVGTSKGQPDLGVWGPLVTDEIAKIKKAVDKQMWQGSIAGGDIIDGWATKVAADTDVITVTSTGVDINNIDDIVNDIILAITDDMWSRGQYTIHMPMAYYNLYRQNRINANFYHENPNKPALEMDVFGWEGQVTIKAEPGLTGTKHIITTWDGNLVVGTDELREVSSFNFHFEPITKNVYLMSDFKLGVEYKYGSEIVYFVGA